MLFFCIKSAMSRVPELHHQLVTSPLTEKKEGNALETGNSFLWRKEEKKSSRQIKPPDVLSHDLCGGRKKGVETDGEIWRHDMQEQDFI